MIKELVAFVHGKALQPMTFSRFLCFFCSLVVRFFFVVVVVDAFLIFLFIQRLGWRQFVIKTHNGSRSSNSVGDGIHGGGMFPSAYVSRKLYAKINIYSSNRFWHVYEIAVPYFKTTADEVNLSLSFHSFTSSFENALHLIIRLTCYYLDFTMINSFFHDSFGFWGYIYV